MNTPYTHDTSCASCAERGSNLVETALVSILLLLLIGGMVDFGGAFHHYIIIANAAREGARTAARIPCKSDNRAALRTAVVQSVIEEAAGSNVALAAANVAITPDPIAAGCAVAGAPVRVAITVSYTTLLGGLWGGDAAITLRNSAVMPYAGAD